MGGGGGGGNVNAHEVTFPPNYVDLYEQKPKLNHLASEFHHS